MAAPGPRDLIEGDNLELTVETSPPEGLQYQWRRNGEPLTDDRRTHGSRSPALTISGAHRGDIGDYDVLITGEACAVASPLAPVSVEEVGIRCDEVSDFSAGCFQGEIRIVLRLDSRAHDGERVRFVVDGARKRALVRGDVAIKRLSGAVGFHTVEVMDPQACGLSTTFECR